MGDRSYSFDAIAALSDGTLSYSGSGYAQYQGNDGIVDCGGNQQISYLTSPLCDVSSLTPQRARTDAVVVIIATAGTFTGTALFKIYAVASNDPTFGPGNVVPVNGIAFGNAAGLEFPNGMTTAAPPPVGGSVYEMPVCMEQNNVKLEYLKLYNVVANGAALTYEAFLGVLPEP